MESRVIEISKIDEAISYLSDEVKEHSQRVSQYAQILFNQIVSEELYSETGAGRRDLVAENRNVVAEAGLYHDIGKAFVPELYQVYNQKFTAEEDAVYKKHVEDGHELVPRVMDGFSKRPSVEKRFILSAIMDHHEFSDGTGFPNAKEGKDISYIGRIIALVDTFDKLSMKIVSETPVEEALVQMKTFAETKIDPLFYKSLCSCKGKLKKVFLTYGASSQVIRTTDTFVKRRNRPMNLEFREIHDPNKEFVGYDCQMCFSDGKENNWHYDDVKHIISKQGIAVESCLYFVYEACDTLRRFDTYNIKSKSATIEIIPTFFSKKNVVKNFLAVIENEELNIEQIRVAVPFIMLEKPTKALLTSVQDFTKAQIPIMVKDVDYKLVSPNALKEMGFSSVRLNQEANNQVEEAEFKNWMKEAVANEMYVAVDGTDKTRTTQMLFEMGVKEITGALVGDFETEATILAREIALRQTKNAE